MLCFDLARLRSRETALSERPNVAGFLSHDKACCLLRQLRQPTVLTSEPTTHMCLYRSDVDQPRDFSLLQASEYRSWDQLDPTAGDTLFSTIAEESLNQLQHQAYLRIGYCSKLVLPYF